MTSMRRFVPRWAPWLVAFAAGCGGGSAGDAGAPHAASALSGAVSLASPSAGSTVSGAVTLSAQVDPSVAWVDFYVDGSYLSSSPPYTRTWDSTAVGDGTHTLSVSAFDSSDALVGTANAAIVVQNHGCIAITSPPNGASIGGSTPIATSDACPGVWFESLLVDGAHVADFDVGAVVVDATTLTDGSHTVTVTSQSENPGSRTLGAASITVNVQTSGGTGGNGIAGGATIASLTGDGSGIPGADTDPAHYGQYGAPGGSGAGYGLIGGPLLDDDQAYSFTVATPPSSVETGPQGPANAQDDGYFSGIAASDPSGYLNQLDSFHSAYQGSAWQAVADRIDGACPMANPTTAEVLQWAANKWGINPILLYAEAVQEGDWDNTSLGDNGTSSGVLQLADRGSSHAFPGFAGAGQNLSRENTCFNADFYAGHLYAAFHGMTGEAPPGDVGAAIQAWFSGTVGSAGSYTQSVYGHITQRDWVSAYFQGQNIPY